ncbi:hypothetical protein HAX54_014485 [Datura stramonium]|uniref:Uncharacterized protein n=1 Tax=Datura stramonium TaxID=4076 RepID=A0ABS8RJD1_DATST|nr:hypothetical protein [Datura stramonium]
MKFLQQFQKVEETEGWKFLQRHDPLLSRIFQFMDEPVAEEEEEETHAGAELVFTAKRRDGLFGAHMH